MPKITHEKFQEKLKELGADQISTISVWGHNKAKIKRTYGEFSRSAPGAPAVRVRAEYQQDRVQGVILSNGLGNIWLREFVDLDAIIAMFEKVKILKKFVGDES